MQDVVGNCIVYLHDWVRCWTYMPLCVGGRRSRSSAGKGRIIEGHPEVSFALMNDRSAIREPKRTIDGQRFRLALLREHVDPESESFVVRLGKGLRVDAIDALALIWTGRRFRAGMHETFPPTPDRDSLGVEAAIRA